jgi:hypothetical protein
VGVVVVVLLLRSFFALSLVAKVPNSLSYTPPTNVVAML